MNLQMPDQWQISWLIWVLVFLGRHSLLAVCQELHHCLDIHLILRETRCCLKTSFLLSRRCQRELCLGTRGGLCASLISGGEQDGLVSYKSMKTGKLLVSKRLRMVTDTLLNRSLLFVHINSCLRLHTCHVHMPMSCTKCKVQCISISTNKGGEKL